MAIIKQGRKSDDKRVIRLPSANIPIDTDEIPFIPAQDLIPGTEPLSDKEIASIALALSIMVPAEEETQSLWRTNRSLQAIMGRMS